VGRWGWGGIEIACKGSLAGKSHDKLNKDTAEPPGGGETVADRKTKYCESGIVIDRARDAVIKKGDDWFMMNTNLF